MTLLVLSKITLCFWSLPDRFIYRLIYILNNSKWTSTFKCFTLLSLRRTQQEARLTHMPTLHHCQLRDNFILLTNIKDFFFEISTHFLLRHAISRDLSLYQSDVKLSTSCWRLCFFFIYTSVLGYHKWALASRYIMVSLINNFFIGLVLHCKYLRCLPCL